MRRLLVANRGEIARRVFLTCRRLGIDTVAVYSAADGDALHVADADLAVPLPGPPEAAYVDPSAVVEAARRTGADAVHPGYGFLAEDPRLAAAVTGAGLTFLGPPAAVMATMADKVAARAAAAGAGIEVVPGGRPGEREWRYPLLVKAVAGGGGRGMVRVDDAADLAGATETAARRARAVLGDDRVYVEEMVNGARHVEVQVLADAHGGVVHVYDRECSVQRRFQKVIEEAPAPGLPVEVRHELTGAACRLAKAVGYLGAGTVEFLVDGDGRCWFLEMNTRLQVEHPVTEAVTGLDLVEQQIRIADGERLPAQEDLPPVAGHAVEARLLAEDPGDEDLPQTGRLHRFEVAGGDGVRVDTGVASGSEVGGAYDSLLAKVVVHRASRRDAVSVLASVLARTRVHGVTTNRDLLVNVLRHPEFLSGSVDTTWLQRAGADVRHPRLGPELVAQAAAAAAVALAARERSAAPVMASIPAGFRNVAAGPWRRRFEAAGGPVEVAYRLFPEMAATVGGWAMGLAVAADGRMVVTADGVERRFEVSAYPERIVVDAAEGSVDLVEPAPHGTRPAATADGRLVAPVPGRVAVAAAVGTEVAPGDAVVVIESMKMEHAVTAALAGTVDTVVDVGALVAAGQTVATVTARAAADRDAPD